MIVLVTFMETDENGKETGKELVSHGLDEGLREIILPAVPPEEIGYYNLNIGEWVLKE